MRTTMLGVTLAIFTCSACSDDAPPVAPAPVSDTTDSSTISEGVSHDTDATGPLDAQSDTQPDATNDGISDSIPDSPTSPDAEPEVTPDALPDSLPDTAPTPADTQADSTDSSGTSDASSGPWPTNPNKDQIEDPGWDSTPGNGTVMPNFTALDQYGSYVEFYDLAMDGRPIVLDIGTWFCEPCKSLAWFLSTGETGECPYSETILADLGWWNESYELIKELVDTGEIRWVSVLYSLGTPVTGQDASAWHETFPHDEVVVLADSTLQLQEYLSVEAMPRIDVLDEEMTFLVYHTGGPNKGLQKLVALFGD